VLLDRRDPPASGEERVKQVHRVRVVPLDWVERVRVVPLARVELVKQGRLVPPDQDLPVQAVQVARLARVEQARRGRLGRRVWEKPDLMVPRAWEKRDQRVWDRQEKEHPDRVARQVHPELPD